MEKIQSFLNPFLSWTKKTEGSKIPTLCYVWPGIDFIVKHCGVSGSDLDFIAQMKAKAIQYIEKKFELHDYAKIAAFLHPNLKMLKFASSEDVENTINEVKKMIGVQSNESTPNASATIATSSSILSQYYDDSTYCEIDEYIAYKVARDDHLDLIKWWIERSDLFPKLAKLALFVHCLPAGATPSERCFSTAGNVLTDKRTNLNVEQIENIIILHSRFEEIVVSNEPIVFFIIQLFRSLNTVFSLFVLEFELIVAQQLLRKH